MCQFSHFYLLSSGVKYVCIVAAISRTFSSYNAKVLYPESNYAPPPRSLFLLWPLLDGSTTSSLVSCPVELSALSLPQVSLLDFVTLLSVPLLVMPTLLKASKKRLLEIFY